MITSYGITETGLVRPVNEDCIFVGDRFFILADGMGGYEGGQLASSTAVDAVRQFLADRSGTYSPGIVQDAVLCANRAILYKKMTASAFPDMGTTLTLAAISDAHLYWAHVGDSRLYMWKNGVLSQVTRDHSFVMTLVEEGMLTRKEMQSHPRKNEITRAVGIQPALNVDTGVIALDDPAIFLICSDGLSTMIDDERIESALSHCEGGKDALEDCAHRLIGAVYETGATDNVSAIFIQFTPDHLK